MPVYVQIWKRRAACPQLVPRTQCDRMRLAGSRLLSMNERESSKSPFEESLDKVLIGLQGLPRTLLRPRYLLILVVVGAGWAVEKLGAEVLKKLVFSSEAAIGPPGTTNPIPPQPSSTQAPTSGSPVAMPPLQPFAPNAAPPSPDLAVSPGNPARPYGARSPVTQLAPASVAPASHGHDSRQPATTSDLPNASAQSTLTSGSPPAATVQPMTSQPASGPQRDEDRTQATKAPRDGYTEVEEFLSGRRPKP